MSFLELVAQVRPNQVTLVPDSPEQSTSNHGWALAHHAAPLAPVIARLQQLGIRVSLFIKPCASASTIASRIGADRIELYTGPYWETAGAAAGEQCLAELAATAWADHQHGLGVNAGHDLTLSNLTAFQAKVTGAIEVSIGTPSPPTPCPCAFQLRFGNASQP